MKYLTAMLCAMGLWVNLPLDAGAVESPERVGLSADASRMAHAADRPAAGADKAAVTAAPRRGLAAAPRQAAEHARSIANNSHSSLGQPARGRVANGMSRLIPPKRAAATDRTTLTWKPRDASPIVPREPFVSNNAVRTPPNLKIVPRGSTLGGPRVAGPGRPGGLPTGRAANLAVMDGMQLHHKF